MITRRILALWTMVLAGCSAYYHSERNSDGSTVTVIRGRAGATDLSVQPDGITLRIDAPQTTPTRLSTTKASDK